MSTNMLQAEHVRTKVLYSEVDTPFNSYLEVLSKVTKLSSHILKGELQEYESTSKIKFDGEYIKELKQAAELKFLELQGSLDVKKVAEENWEQKNNDTLKSMEAELELKVPELEDSYDKLQNRIARVRELYKSVSKVNSEMEVLLESNTSLTTIKSEWEMALGTALTEKLIKQNYLRKAGKLNGEERYRVYDNFTKGPTELKHINKSIKSDIDRLKQEVESYREKWLKDADIFTRMTSVLRDELSKRDMNVDDDMEDEEEQDEDRDIERYRRQRIVQDDQDLLNVKQELEEVDEDMEGRNEDDDIDMNSQEESDLNGEAALDNDKEHFEDDENSLYNNEKSPNHDERSPDDDDRNADSDGRSIDAADRGLDNDDVEEKMNQESNVAYHEEQDSHIDNESRSGADKE